MKHLVVRAAEEFADADAGFAAWNTIDPVVIADTAGGGTLNSLDVTRLLQEVNFLAGVPGSADRAEIAPLPAGAVYLVLPTIVSFLICALVVGVSLFFVSVGEG